MKERVSHYLRHGSGKLMGLQGGRLEVEDNPETTVVSGYFRSGSNLGIGMGPKKRGEDALGPEEVGCIGWALNQTPWIMYHLQPFSAKNMLCLEN